MLLLQDNFTGRLTYLMYRNRVFFTFFWIIWIAVSTVQTFFSQREIILFVNALHTPVSDYFFWVVTALGNGVFVIAVAVLIFFFSKKQAAIVVTGYLLSGAFVQLSKKFIFMDRPRPMKALADIFEDLHKVDGVHFFGNNSFPSGHTTSAFALFTTLAIMSRSRTLALLCLLTACLAGFSRVYLLQHFLRDVHTGAILGIFAALICQVIFDKYWPLNQQK